MKLLFALHAWSPDPPDEAVSRAAELAAALRARGDEVVVVAGASAPGAEASLRPAAADDGPRVLRLARGDAAPDHWQRTRSVQAARLLREVLRAERPEVLHVHHWRRLTRDLVAIAAEAGVPAVVTLHDAWIGCLIGTRILPDGTGACDAPLGMSPCLSCADAAGLATPWVPLEARFMELAERRRDLARELRIAHAVCVRSSERAAALCAALGDDVAGLDVRVVPESEAAYTRLYAQAVAAGVPARAGAAPEWWEERMRMEAEATWDAGWNAAGARAGGSKP